MIPTVDGVYPVPLRDAYHEVNAAIYDARRKFSDRGIDLIIIMSQEVLARYCGYAPPNEWTCPVYSGFKIHGYDVFIASNIQGYKICRGA